MKTRHRKCPFFIGLVLLHLLFQWAIAEKDEKIVWIEGRYFDSVGTDNRSVSFANALGEHVAELCQRYLKAGSHDFPGRILATLRPEKNVDFEEGYQIQVSPRGQVSLDIFWDESLSFEMTCRAFTEAYLLYYAQFNYGVGADERIRYWAISALVSRIYLSLRSAQKTNFIRAARLSEIIGIESLLSVRLAKVTDKKQNLYQVYCLLQILRESGLKKLQLTILLDQAIAGVDVTNQLSELIFSSNKKESETLLKNWWQNELESYLAQEYEFCDSLTTSLLWIDEMADFGAYRAVGGELENLMELWTYRHDEALRSVLSARCEIIRLRIAQVNPAYFNAALSLGALYETVLEAENKHEFVSSVIAYLNDWEDTKRLHTRTEELLSVCD